MQDVDIAWDRIRSWATRRGHPGDTAASLVLRLADGSTRAISPRPYRGYHLHLRAERALRDLLGLAARAASDQALFDQRATSFRPPPVMGGGWGAPRSGSRGSGSVEGWTLAVGAGGGAVLGVAVAIALTRRAESR